MIVLTFDIGYNVLNNFHYRQKKKKKGSEEENGSQFLKEVLDAMHKKSDARLVITKILSKCTHFDINYN